jgi:hypothetical protein
MPVPTIGHDPEPVLPPSIVTAPLSKIHLNDKNGEVVPVLN